jgi:hypothetical protein
MKWWRRGLLLAGALNTLFVASFVAGALLDQPLLYSFGSVFLLQFVWLTALADAVGLETVGTCFTLCELSMLGWILVPVSTAATACLYLLFGRLSLKWWPA